jgi:Spx/MgsR family transcriptional regulator
MLTIYGIKNCDVMAKAFKWLDGNKIPYRFHNFREQALDEATVAQWLQCIAPEKLINQKSTTWRQLQESEKEALKQPEHRIALLLQYPTLFKRPVWDFGDGRLDAGWNEAAIAAQLAQ